MFEVLMWDVPFIPDIDDCKGNPCSNDAKCVDLVNDYKCECKPGYEGKNCDKSKN